MQRDKAKRLGDVKRLFKSRGHSDVWLKYRKPDCKPKK